MTPAEQKQYLQSIGVLPPADVESGIQAEPQPVQEQAPPAPPVNPDDPREKLKALMTPELMQGLRKKAGRDPGQV